MSFQNNHPRKLKCMYTKQLLKKRKTWMDGILKVTYNGSGYQCTLMDAANLAGKCLDGRQLTSMEAGKLKSNEEFELELESYLVEVLSEANGIENGQVAAEPPKKVGPPLKLPKFVPPSRYVPPVKEATGSYEYSAMHRMSNSYAPAPALQTDNPQTGKNWGNIESRYVPVKQTGPGKDEELDYSKRGPYRVADEELDELWENGDDSPGSDTRILGRSSGDCRGVGRDDQDDTQIASKHHSSLLPSSYQRSSTASDAGRTSRTHSRSLSSAPDKGSVSWKMQTGNQLKESSGCGSTHHGRKESKAESREDALNFGNRKHDERIIDMRPACNSDSGSGGNDGGGDARGGGGGIGEVDSDLIWTASNGFEGVDSCTIAWQDDTPQRLCQQHHHPHQQSVAKVAVSAPAVDAEVRRQIGDENYGGSNSCCIGGLNATSSSGYGRLEKDADLEDPVAAPFYQPTNVIDESIWG